MFFICNQDGCSIPAETLLEQQSVPHPILVKNARSNLNPTPQNDKYAFFYTHFQPPPLSQDQNESYDQRGPKKKKQICHYPLLPQMTSRLSFIHIFNHHPLSQEQEPIDFAKNIGCSTWPIKSFNNHEVKRETSINNTSM